MSDSVRSGKQELSHPPCEASRLVYWSVSPFFIESRLYYSVEGNPDTSLADHRIASAVKIFGPTSFVNTRPASMLGDQHNGMPVDHTQQQSLGGLRRSERLSLHANTPPSDIPGYRIERLLGRGAFGQVWMGVDLNTGRPVAIKCYLHPGNTKLPSLNREVHHLVNMSTGRYIVQVLQVGWDHDPPYYVMEYLENGSLEDLIRSQGSLSVGQAIALLREIAEGLNYAHGKGVLHCDLKPANVMLDHDWRPRLADFGQGRMTGDQTPSLGTLFFMAPEQADLNASPDVTWDVYALGAIGYSMLVGSPPHRTAEVIEALDTANSLPDRLLRYRETILGSPRPRLHHRRRSADKALCQIIDRCLKVNPEERFQNVQQVIEAIDNRQRARTRRPLYLLGIVGPILLMLLMLLFSARSISFATQESLQSVVTRSLESNQFAARYAAQTLESEIQSLFRIVESETQRAELVKHLNAISSSGAGLLERAANGESTPENKELILALDERKQLEKYLKSRLMAMIGKNGNSSAIFNSLFVNEQHGTNVGIAFTDAEEQTAISPVGDNFAYRSYFNGQRADAARDAIPRDIAATRTTRLSASFRSTSTGAWKLGISAPIWSTDAFLDDGEAPREDAVPIGVLVLTINLGDFELLAEQASPSSPYTRFAALVDGRPGNQRGTLLQHPLIRAMDREVMKSVLMPQIDQLTLERLQSGTGISDYLDPAAKFSNGQVFEGTWIATIEQIRLPRVQTAGEEVRTMSDLWILVQERSSSVAAPIRSLGTQLQRESIIELISLLLVTLVLWYFVFRVGQASLSKGSGEPPLESASSSGLDATVTNH